MLTVFYKLFFCMKAPAGFFRIFKVKGFTVMSLPVCIPQVKNVAKSSPA